MQAPCKECFGIALATEAAVERIGADHDSRTVDAGAGLAADDGKQHSGPQPHRAWGCAASQEHALRLLAQRKVAAPRQDSIDLLIASAMSHI